MPLQDCRIIDLPRIADSRGALTVIEGHQHVPFEIRRVYYLYAVPNNASRGSHGHKKLEQLMIAISGSLDVIIDDGLKQKSVHLSSPHQGLYICSEIWRDLRNFSPGAICLVLASHHYDETDYYRDYREFLAAKGLA